MTKRQLTAMRHAVDWDETMSEAAHYKKAGRQAMDRVRSEQAMKATVLGMFKNHIVGSILR